MPSILPSVQRPKPLLLADCSKDAYVDYYRCADCRHVWTTSKEGGIHPQAHHHPERAALGTAGRTWWLSTATSYSPTFDRAVLQQLQGHGAESDHMYAAFSASLKTILRIDPPLVF